jgi:hypothetical protein
VGTGKKVDGTFVRIKLHDVYLLVLFCTLVDNQDKGKGGYHWESCKVFSFSSNLGPIYMAIMGISTFVHGSICMSPE